MCSVWISASLFPHQLQYLWQFLISEKRCGLQFIEFQNPSGSFIFLRERMFVLLLKRSFRVLRDFDRVGQLGVCHQSNYFEKEDVNVYLNLTAVPLHLCFLGTPIWLLLEIQCQTRCALDLLFTILHVHSAGLM